MTLRRPEEKTLAQWCFEGLNLKTVILMVVSICACYYTTGTRVTVIEAGSKETDRRFDDTTRRLDAQRDMIKSKVDKDTYDMDQKRLAEELAAIRDSEGRIEDILMERHSR